MSTPRFAVWFDADITVKELIALTKGAGLHLRTDGYGRMVVDQVPEWLRHDPPNVVRLRKTKP